MKTAFADTLYWVAIAYPKDQWHAPALRARKALGEDAVVVTTDEVLIEFANALSKNAELRALAVRIVHAILDDPKIKVFPQARDGFLQGLERYQNRPDKQYSLTDCISMNVMDRERIQEVLTNDRHFEQEGFMVLVKGNGS